MNRGCIFRVCAEWPNGRLYGKRKLFFFLSFCTVLKRGKSGGFGNTNAKLGSEEQREASFINGENST